MGAVSRVPVELTFIQLSSGHFHSCGITLDEKLVCWGGPNPKRFEPPGLYQQVSCGAVHTCGLRKDGQVKCWSFGRRPFLFFTLASYAVVAAMASCAVRVPVAAMACRWERNPLAASRVST